MRAECAGQVDAGHVVAMFGEREAELRARGRIAALVAVGSSV
jgi:hypothetical protein